MSFHVTESPTPDLAGSLGVSSKTEHFEGVVGIDLGTTYSCIAVFMDSTAHVIANDQGMRTTPSMVALEVGPSQDDNDMRSLYDGDLEAHFLIGNAAFNISAKGAKNVAYDSKRIIGRRFGEREIQQDMKLWPFTIRPKGFDFSDDCSNISKKASNASVVITLEAMNPENKILIRRDFEPEEISAMILYYLRQCAERYLGKIVTKAVITVPAHFNDRQRERTKVAGLIAGWEVLRIINEPTAAALAYGIGSQMTFLPDSGSEGGVSFLRNIVIFDFGGGTFDVSVISVEEGIYEVCSTAGDAHLGGQDLDLNLLKYILEECKIKFSIDLSSSRRAMAKLKILCENAKRALTYNTQETLVLDEFFNTSDDEYSSKEITISRAKFESLNEALFKQCMKIVHDALTDAKLKPNDIHHIVLTGGSSRIPKVQRMLSDIFDKDLSNNNMNVRSQENSKLCHTVNPDEAVAVGAAIQGAIMSTMSAQKCEKIKKNLLIDVISLSIGVDIDGGKFDVLVPRNTPIPYCKKKEFTTSHNNQEDVDIAVYEGESPLVKNNHMLGFFKLEGITKARRGAIDIVVTFSIDENCMLTVTAEEKSKQRGTDGKRKSLVVGCSERLNAEEAQHMINRVTASKEQDRRKLHVLKAITTLRATANDLMTDITVLSSLKKVMATTNAQSSSSESDHKMAPTADVDKNAPDNLSNEILVIPSCFSHDLRKKLRALQKPLLWLFSSKAMEAESVELIQSKLEKLENMMRKVMDKCRAQRTAKKKKHRRIKNEDDDEGSENIEEDEKDEAKKSICDKESTDEDA